jgi:ubiquinone/menaquinone biosynthesis C-methylase UbiE
MILNLQHYKLTHFTTKIRSNLLLKQYSHWLKKNDRVLDVGCGDGILSSIIIKKIGVKLTGCDIENYLQIKIPFILMQNQFSLPFPDNSFDKIMFNDVLHHISFQNQKKLIKEALRVSNNILIFEVEPTMIGSLADYIINKFHNLNMNIPLTFRNHSEWIKLFHYYSVQNEFIEIKKPFLYPFNHEAFYIYKKSNK